MKRIPFTLAAFAVSMPVAFIAQPVHAASPWFLTSTVKDKDGTQQEFIIPHSVLKLGNGKIGRVYGFMVKDTFSPAAGDIQSVISSAVVDCDHLTWGKYASLAFKADGEPVMFDTPRVNETQPVWLPKDMGFPNPAAYQTLKYICAGS